MPSGTRSKSRSPSSSKRNFGSKTRKVRFSEKNPVIKYSLGTPSPTPYVPACTKNVRGKIAEYPCKLKYTVFQNEAEYREFQMYLHTLKSQDPDYVMSNNPEAEYSKHDFNKIQQHYKNLRKTGNIPIAPRRKKR